MVNCRIMTVSPKRAELPTELEEDGTITNPHPEFAGGFDPLKWEESDAHREFRGAGGREVLGSALVILAALWVGYCAWAAGRALGDQPLSSPQIAQWLALAAGPLALLGLAWIMFGRTRRKEAERFTQSVITMRAEARSLEALLGVLSQRIDDSQTELGSIAQRLMQLGDETTGKLGGITTELDSSSNRLARYGEALDRAAESARNDIAVLLEDLPRAEESARTMAEQLRTAGGEATRQSAAFADQLSAISARTVDAELTVATATQQLSERLAEIEAAGSAAAVRVGEAETRLSTTTTKLLEQTVATLDQIRNGVDAQAAAVSALVQQSMSGIGRAGIEAADALGASVSEATSALDALSARIAEQERASERVTAHTARALGELEQQFSSLTAHGDERAAAFVGALGRARAELQELTQETNTQDGALQALSGRTVDLRECIHQLSSEVREQLVSALGDSEAGATRLMLSAQKLRPELEWMRVAAVEASDRITASTSGVAEQQDRLTALLASLEEGVGTAESRLTSLANVITDAQSEAARLSNETGPALVEAMVQVKEAAAHAAERAREAIASVVPETAESLSAATREALERVIREEVDQRLCEVETTAARAVDAARAASDRLTQQMLTLGQSAAALERHVEQVSAAEREKNSEAFARRVALLIDSMHSASIDVGKILSDEVDEKAWDSYLKGNRGVFTRRAVRLIEGTETKAIRAHYDADREFHQSVDRYVHDFEAMLRRVVAERDGGMIAVTLMSSDMGKLYAALAQVVDKRR
jgi:predicted  nucleic acid-binding Zn-ribbon protein